MRYNGIINSHNSEVASDKEGENRLSYTKLQEPIQSLNITFPVNDEYLSSEQNMEDTISRGNIQIKETIGTKGLKSVMDYVDERSADNMVKGMFEYKPWVQKSQHANFLSRDKIGSYSPKMKIY